jgi:glycosyltransferase involved in cell wall biosynthesis
VSEPLVSVILPTYRRAHTIGRAIASVLAQTLRDFELIVVDDCSGDDTARVVAEIAATDPRVRFVARPVNGGAAAARNTGLHHARGRYIAFQDSDDEWLPDKLAQQVARLESLPPDVAVTQAAILRHDSHGVTYLQSELPAGDQRITILRCNMTTFFQGWLARRDALLSVGDLDERLGIWDDWEYLLRICQRFRADFDARHVALVYDTPGSLTNQERLRAPALRRILDVHAELMAPHPAILAYNLYVLGHVELGDGRTALGRRALYRSLKLDPRPIKAWGLLAVSLVGARFTRLVAGWLRRRRLARAAAPATRPT